MNIEIKSIYVLFFSLQIKAMEKLSKSLHDGCKLSAKESYQNLACGIDNQDILVNNQHQTPYQRHRQRSLNLDEYLEDQGENKTDDEKLWDSNGEWQGVFSGSSDVDK